MKNEKLFIITRNGKFDPISTYKPVVMRKLKDLGNKIDYAFVNGHWPH